MRERLFRFKKFSVSHEKSAMKVGVDGVLVGAWATPVEGRILDVGTGCGLIALMMAQRCPEAEITGIDIHDESVEEACGNVARSEWKGRVSIHCLAFGEQMPGCGPFDLIVSNPPFFDSGVKVPVTPREQARHCAELTPVSLLEKGSRMLADNGIISLIATAEAEEGLKAAGERSGLRLSRSCRVRDHAGSPIKRVMMEFKRVLRNNVGDRAGTSVMKETPAIMEELVMFGPDGEPTGEYRQLCRDFYLRF